MYLRTSAGESAMHNTSPLRTFAPAAPPTYISHLPPSIATTPTSLTVASAQLRGQPETAILTLWGISMPWKRFSMSIPSEVLSPSPKRQKSVPTHVLHVLNAFGVSVAGGHVQLSPDIRQVLPWECPGGLYAARR